MKIVIALAAEETRLAGGSGTDATIVAEQVPGVSLVVSRAEGPSGSYRVVTSASSCVSYIHTFLL